MVGHATSRAFRARVDGFPADVHWLLVSLWTLVQRDRLRKRGGALAHSSVLRGTLFDPQVARVLALGLEKAAAAACDLSFMLTTTISVYPSLEFSPASTEELTIFFHRVKIGSAFLD